MISTSQTQTEQLGISLAAQLRPGDVLLLRGEMGVGKTVFARGVARGLHVEGPIASPTYTILHCHMGRLPLHHFDLYRLQAADEFEAAGLCEYVGGDVVTLIEWPDRAGALLPADHLDITIAYGAADDERIITITPAGAFREVSL